MKAINKKTMRIVKKTRIRIITGATLTALMILALSAPESEGQGKAPAYKIIEVTDGGSVFGVVRFDTKYPPQKKIRVSKDNETCGTIKLSERFLVSKDNKGLKNVLVTVEGVTSGKAPSPAKSVTLVQNGCTYLPHFQVAEIGADGINIKLLNEDGIFHNVHTYHEDTTLFNVPHLALQKEINQHIAVAGIVKVKCDVHAWMSANIALLKDQPYYAVTDENGSFSIGDIPAGTYTLRAWHEGLPVMEKELTITAEESSEVDFVIKGKKKKKKQ
ncbi:MAG: carboxypeptidase regulatory-like domain-containing protein [candidate division Zixibacteria bacterium]|nr:carboxypeptidase regulatory-like domain-containing protein [candidate division Zixibacteria bacterium]